MPIIRYQCERRGDAELISLLQLTAHALGWSRFAMHSRLEAEGDNDRTLSKGPV